MTEQDAVAIQKFDGSMALTPMTPAQAIQRHEMLVAFIKESLVENRDYGLIPGTEKKSLWKPGAEKLCTLFGYSVRLIPSQTEQDWTGKEHGGEPFFFYEYKCEIMHGGVKVVDSYGSCNSFEKKYRYREGKRVCPKCGKESIYRSKPRENDPKDKPLGWYCWAKKGGCGAQFPANDQAIASQKVGMVKNDEIFDQVNTVLKMAQKRAFVGSTVIACNGSEFFSTEFDEEDYDKGALNIMPIVVIDSPAVIEAKMRAASSALRGDQGELDLGPDWNKEPSPSPHPTEPPAPEQPHDNGKTKPAALKFQPFVTWCNEWVHNNALAAKYAKEDNRLADIRHILGRVGKLGFAEITEANAEEIKAALANYVAKADAA